MVFFELPSSFCLLDRKKEGAVRSVIDDSSSPLDRGALVVKFLFDVLIAQQRLILLFWLVLGNPLLEVQADCSEERDLTDQELGSSANSVDDI